MQEKMKRLNLRDELNILVLGETGVGKSTWINAIANYLKFNNLDDALQSNDSMIAMIPSHFNMTNDDGEFKPIKIGDPDSNEVDSPGQSSTQETRAYCLPLKHGSKKIRIIDTPGIGDTRGIEQDKMNIANILSYIQSYEHIHGICILFKSNECRATISFKFCLKELLKSLDKSAQDCIAFCLTNARGTFYRPGETKGVLSKLLKDVRERSLDQDIHLDITKSNTFCMDNEAFRFLAAAKNDLHFEDNVKELYSNIWDQAVESITKLLEFISNSNPHDVQKTTSLNTSRTLILTLTKPMAEMTKQIGKTINTIGRQSEELKACEGNVQRLKEKLTFVGTTLEMKDLPRPRTVCTDADCKTSHFDHATDERKTVYHKHCHPQCYLDGITVGSRGEAGLQYCWAMNKGHMTTTATSSAMNDDKSKIGYCHQCGHHWSAHMHMIYELITISKKFRR